MHPRQLRLQNHLRRPRTLKQHLLLGFVAINLALQGLPFLLQALECGPVKIKSLLQGSDPHCRALGCGFGRREGFTLILKGGDPGHRCLKLA